MVPASSTQVDVGRNAGRTLTERTPGLYNTRYLGGLGCS
jgi:hypothetical protein